MQNPIQLMQMMKNPQAFINQAMNNSQIMQNPIGRNAIEMYRSGNIQGLNELANNLCREKGTSFDEVKSRIQTQLFR